MFRSRLSAITPRFSTFALAAASGLMLVLAFPDFELWFLAFVALVPLFFALAAEQESAVRSALTGWFFGVVFFYGSCWWLTFAPITYANFPPPLAYLLLFFVAAAAAIFPALFAALLSVIAKRFGSAAILAAPFAWVFTEYLRYWITGNNWNAIAYSQAFRPAALELLLAGAGGIYTVGFAVVTANVLIAVMLAYLSSERRRRRAAVSEPTARRHLPLATASAYAAAIVVVAALLHLVGDPGMTVNNPPTALIVAVQPNVPMSGLSDEKRERLRQNHVRLAEAALQTVPAGNKLPVTVIFPESPMNFAYEEDPEFRQFISSFAARNNVNVIFNAAEPDAVNKKYFNSAVLVDSQGREIVQYDKIYLLPFGEFVPMPLQAIIPAFVGSFSPGQEYDSLPLGDARAGIVICFESHFGELSRRYVADGADAIIEMTNDGYLGPTPVLRQHLANAAFRAAETNRPVLRVTNVGVTAYIDRTGAVIDPAETYTEASRIWQVARSGGEKTIYVKYGDWFALLSAFVTITAAILSAVLARRRSATVNMQQ